MQSTQHNRLCGLIVRVRVVPRRTVVGDIDRRFDNSPSRDYSHPDDETTQTTETPGFKQFTVLLNIMSNKLGKCFNKIHRKKVVNFWFVNT